MHLISRQQLYRLKGMVGVIILRKQVCGLRSAAEDVNSLARLEPMERVGDEVSRSDSLVTDTTSNKCL